jgi:two-component system chemotaxis response regulator CheY
MANPRILSVGQCAYDHGKIARQLERHVNAVITGADTLGETLTELRSGAYDLVLVNRVLDADGSSGLDLIQGLKADPALASTPVMLVSNLPKAQADAIALGALPGFGKAELTAPEALARIESALSAKD